jgi:hypothetical protein
MVFLFLAEILGFFNIDSLQKTKIFPADRKTQRIMLFSVGFFHSLEIFGVAACPH